MKIDGGIPISVMKDIAILNGESISLKKVKRLELFSKGKSCNTLMRFFSKKMILSNEIKQLIVVGRGKGIAIPYTHCVTFIKVGDSLALCDCTEKEMFWFPKIPKSQVGRVLVPNDQFD